MSFFKEFNSKSFDDWSAAVERELKGKTFVEYLHFSDRVEGLEQMKYADSRTFESKGMSYYRSPKSTDNNWEVHQAIEVKDEKVANARALEVLNLGATSLEFHLKKEKISWSALFENIGLDFIESCFKTCSVQQQKDLIANWKSYSKKLLNFINDTPEFISDANVQAQSLVDAYGVHKVGGNMQQELTYALLKGHDEFVKAMSSGLSADQASAAIRFRFGADSKYLFEIAKLRVFRKLWSTIVAQYKPEANCSMSAYVYSCTSMRNISLKDPYTNLLRQTTEAMSGVVGGANAVFVQPYDCLSKGKKDSLPTRMAINISNLLKEESYMHMVSDPMGGSFSLERLCLELEVKAWSRFQMHEQNEGWENSEVRESLILDIENTIEDRKLEIGSEKTKWIGITAYHNPDSSDLTWIEDDKFLGLEAFNLEKLAQ